MSWHDLAFVHWPVPPDSLRAMVPAGLKIDVFDGSAWVGIVPFWMSGFRVRGMPALRAFPEINVRSYVRFEDRPGVWFFSLDAQHRLAVLAARAWFKLPYFMAEMTYREQEGTMEYTSTRVQRGAAPARFTARYSPIGNVFASAPGSLEHFLTERYCLYAASRNGRILSADIHHVPWPLRRATIEIAENSMAAASHIQLSLDSPHLMFAKRLDVVAWRPRVFAQ